MLGGVGGWGRVVLDVQNHPVKGGEPVCHFQKY